MAGDHEKGLGSSTPTHTSLAEASPAPSPSASAAPAQIDNEKKYVKAHTHTSFKLLALFWADVLVEYALFVMQNYLTQVWGLSFTHAAGILNLWNGIAMVLPLFYAIIRDEILGDFQMLAISSISSSVGIAFIAMSTPPVLAKYTGMCKQYQPECIGHTQKTLFYTGMALIAEGIAGKDVYLRFHDKHQGKQEKDLGKQEQEKQEKDVETLARIFIGTILPVVGAMALPYIRPWSLRFGIPAICTASATILFWSGWHSYDKGISGRSPVRNICEVFVAFISKRNLPYPLDGERIYRGEDKFDKSFTDTPHFLQLRSLEKAAIVLEDRSLEDQMKNKWTLHSISEAKTIVRMVPIMLTFIVCGMVLSIGNTYFVEQANHLNRHIGKWDVPIPALLLFQNTFRRYVGIAKAGFIRNKVYRIRGILIASAMVYSILCCITAAKTEERRLNAIRKHNLMDKPDEDIPMSMYWLLFPFFLLSMSDSILEWGVAEFYDDQVTDGTMKNYLMHVTRAFLGVGYMLNVLSVYVVGKISEKGGKPNWFQFTSNKSRLDRYFWVLSVLSSVNLVLFILVASHYGSNKKTSEAGVEEAPELELGDLPSGLESSSS